MRRTLLALASLVLVAPSNVHADAFLVPSLVRQGSSATVVYVNDYLGPGVWAPTGTTLVTHGSAVFQSGDSRTVTSPMVGVPPQGLLNMRPGVTASASLTYDPPGFFEPSVSGTWTVMTSPPTSGSFSLTGQLLVYPDSMTDPVPMQDFGIGTAPIAGPLVTHVGDATSLNLSFTWLKQMWMFGMDWHVMITDPIVATTFTSGTHVIDAGTGLQPAASFLFGTPGFYSVSASGNVSATRLEKAMSGAITSTPVTGTFMVGLVLVLPSDQPQPVPESSTLPSARDSPRWRREGGSPAQRGGDVESKSLRGPAGGHGEPGVLYPHFAQQRPRGDSHETEMTC